MRTKTAILGASLCLTGWILGCGDRTGEGQESEALLLAEEAVGETSSASSLVEREFWLALAEEPGWHLNAAREEFLNGENTQAAQELGKVAAILNFETRHSHSPRERGLLRASVSELREVARQLRSGEGPFRGGASVEELDRVSALAFRTIAAHQVTLGRDALEAGDARMAGRYISETVNALMAGFERDGTPLGNATTEELDRARQMAARLEIEGEGTHEEGVTTLDNLDRVVTELGNVITGRRR